MLCTSDVLIHVLCTRAMYICSQTCSPTLLFTYISEVRFLEFSHEYCEEKSETFTKFKTNLVPTRNIQFTIKYTQLQKKRTTFMHLL